MSAVNTAESEVTISMSVLDHVTDGNDPSVLRLAAAVTSLMFSLAAVSAAYLAGGVTAVTAIAVISCWMLLHGLMLSVLDIVPRGGGVL